MQLHQSFDVAGSADAAFVALCDLDRLARCLPGITVTGSDGHGAHGRLSVRAAAGLLTIEGDIDIEVVDPDRRETRVVARGAEVDGHGGGRALLVGSVTSVDAERSRVDLTTDLDIEVSDPTTSIREAAIPEVARRLFDQFSRNLEALIGSEVGRISGDVAAPGDPTAPDEQRSVGGDDDQQNGQAWVYATGATVVGVGVIGLLVTWWMRNRSRALGALM